MRKFRLSRRHLLRGAGGAVVGLPLLECMWGGNAAQAQTAIPKRYFLMFHGGSIGADFDDGGPETHYVPTQVGAGYDLKEATRPLGVHGVREEVSIVSGLRIPAATAIVPDDQIPPGGRRMKFHNCTISPVLSGVRTRGGESGEETCNGPTSDWLLSSLVGPGSLMPHVSFRVQPAVYNSGSLDRRGTTAYRLDASNRVLPIPPITSPRQAWQSLFGNFVPPTGGTPTPTDTLPARARKSILDLVGDEADALMPKLGTADRQRVQAHLEEVRALEQRIAVDPPPPPSSSLCVKPADPGVDPAIVGHYSNEEQRAKVLCDLIYMAYVCDLVRTSSICMSLVQSFMLITDLLYMTGNATSPELPIGVGLELHQTGHSGKGQGATQLNIARILNWHLKHFAYLVKRFRDTPEGGGRMLDNMALVFCSEGGFGYDPDGGGTSSPHSTENMVSLIAGRAGGLRGGQHIRTSGAHPAQVILTAMQALGYAKNTFGDVTGPIAGLR